MKEITPEEITTNPIELAKESPILVIKDKNGKTNAMTIGWLSLGVLWSRKTIEVYVKNIRFTHSLLDSATSFSVSWLDKKKYAKEISYLGTHSGRNEDKIATVNLHYVGDVPYLKEAKMAITATILDLRDFDSKDIRDKAIYERFYGEDHGYHTIVVGEINKVFID
jgi:flavin reductase (DIM6/NTAB) family NADH-FMN oxidoreductase RutF